MLHELAVENLPTYKVLTAPKKEVNSWSVFPAFNYQFLSALSTTEVGC